MKMNVTLKHFCTAKETVKKMRRQPKEKEKIFGNHIFYKGLISKIYKNSYSSIAKQNKTT